MLLQLERSALAPQTDPHRMVICLPGLSTL